MDNPGAHGETGGANEAASTGQQSENRQENCCDMYPETHACGGTIIVGNTTRAREAKGKRCALPAPDELDDSVPKASGRR